MQTKKDSIVLKTTIDTAYTSHIETIKERILPAAEIGIVTNKKQLDSLITALGNIPSSVSRTIYYQDPTLRAQLKFTLDAVGNLIIQCESMQHIYNEKSIKDSTYIKQLQSENKKLKEESNKTSEVLKEKTSMPNWLKWLAIWASVAGIILLGFNRLIK